MSVSWRLALIAADGDWVGTFVGDEVTCSDGALVGINVGASVDGTPVGKGDVGDCDGAVEGVSVGL